MVYRGDVLGEKRGLVLDIVLGHREFGGFGLVLLPLLGKVVVVVISGCSAVGADRRMTDEILIKIERLTNEEISRV